MTSRLRWVKVCSYGVWVDDSAFYAVRLRTRNRSVPVYAVNTSYPGCMAQEIGEAGSLAKAKAIAQLDHDGLYAPPSRTEDREAA